MDWKQYLIDWIWYGEKMGIFTAAVSINLRYFIDSFL